MKSRLAQTLSAGLEYVPSFGSLAILLFPETGSHYVSQNGPQLAVLLLPRSPTCWDSRCEPCVQLHLLFDFLMFLR